MSEPKILDLSGNVGNTNNGPSFRLKHIKEDNAEHNNKCTCTRHGVMVTNVCPCLDDDSHMPMLKLPERKEDDDRERRSSLTPGWQAIIQDRICGKDENESATTVDLEDIKCVEKDQKIFCTGSSYVGQWNVLGMKGYGTYIMPHGVEYCGEFEDGQFHGNGTLTYPNGLKIRGVFEKGKMIKWDLQFNDGLEYNVPWNYCKMPDRRFYPEIMDSIKPAGCSYITPEKPPREIPKGCYDTGDGYFDPNMKCIYSAYKPNKILRVASKLEEEWILANCRREEDFTTEYRPDLYAKLVTGCDDYTLERNRSTETLDSDELNDDENREKYIIAELMDTPPVKSELTSRQFGRNVIETPIHDTIEITNDGTWVKTRGNQQRSATGQSAIVSKLNKTRSDPENIPYSYSLTIDSPHADKKKFKASSDKGCIEIEITTNPGEEDQQVADASVHMKKEFETPTSKQNAEISMGSYISSYSSRANTSIDIATDKCTSVLLIDTENKGGEVTIDVQSFSFVEATQSNSNETLDKPLTFKSHYEDTTRLDNVAMGVNNSFSTQAQQSTLKDSIDLSRTSDPSTIDTENNKNNGDINTLSKSTSSIDILSLSATTVDNFEAENRFSIQDPKELESI